MPEHGIGLIIVDSLEMMGGQMKAQTREQEIARGLKGLAQDLNVPVLALSELEITQGRPGWRTCGSREASTGKPTW